MVVLNMKKEPLVILTGPTAAGKTKLSISLAKAVNGEIISADSMQVYKGLDIGSAKIKQSEMEGIRHYLIDILDPKESFDVVQFQSLALTAMKEIRAKGKVPIIVGGTGFYIQSILYDIDFTETRGNGGLRKKYEEIAEKEGVFYLHEMLRQCDSESAKNIPPQNVKRVIRALEFFEETGSKISEHNALQRQKESPYNSAYFVLHDTREKLYEQINRRVDLMMDEGLEEEVKQLKERGLSRGMVSMQGLGYKEILAYLDGEYTKDEAVGIIKRDTRHFAKRQLTWFRREKAVIWLNKQDYAYDEDAILAEILQILKQRGIINVSEIQV